MEGLIVWIWLFSRIVVTSLMRPYRAMQLRTGMEALAPRSPQGPRPLTTHCSIIPRFGSRSHSPRWHPYSTDESGALQLPLTGGPQKMPRGASAPNPFYII